MFCGIPGSGKSTEARRMMAAFSDKGFSVGYVSRDELRFQMISENNGYFSKEKEVFRKFIENTNKSIKQNDITIIDAIHISKASRAKIFNRIEERSDVRLLVLCLTTPLDICMWQNDLRSGRERVPHEAIERMAEGFEEPTVEEFMKYHFESVEVWEKPWKEGES